MSHPVVRQLQPAATEFAYAFNELERLSPEFEGFFRGLGPLITKSERGVPALEGFLQDFPPLLADFEPFLRNFNPLLSHLGQNRREITSFFGNVTAATSGRSPSLIANGPESDPIHYLRASSSLSPQGLGYYPRALGQTRSNPYMAPGGLDRLASGLLTLDPRTCANGDPAPPAQTGDPQLVELALLAEEFAFRTTGGDRNVARPACVGQGTYPGFSTQFPQLEPEP